MKPSTLPPGATAKSQTPRKGPLSSGKPDKPSANGKLKIDEQLPKGDTKKVPEVPKVDNLPKQSEKRERINLHRQSPSTKKPRQKSGKTCLNQQNLLTLFL